MAKPEELTINQPIEVVPPNHPVLREVASKAEPEDLTSPAIQYVIDEMLRIGKGEQGDPDKPFMVGLAAPQVGVSKRIILVALGQEYEKGKITDLVPFINPEITWQSDDILDGTEGCYSIPISMRGIVDRSESVEISYLDRDGNPHKNKYSGLEARIFQHEIDHLDGVVFMDRITNPDRRHLVEPDDHLAYKENWREWSKLLEVKDVEAIRNIPYRES